MASKEKYTGEIVLKDNFTKGIQNASKEVSGFGKTLKDIGKIASGVAIGNIISSSFSKISGAAKAAVHDFGGMILQAAKTDEIRTGFKRNFGDAEKSLGSLRDASKGTISDLELMLQANKASLLGVSDNAEDLAGVMQTARFRAKELGIDMTTAFNDIVTGIGRGSPLILDNLGIRIPDSLKKSMQGMSDLEKTSELTNFVIADGQKLFKEYGGDVLTANDKVQKFDASVENAKDAVGRKFVDAMSGALDALDKFGQSEAGQQLATNFSNALDQIGKFAEGFVKGFTENFGVIEEALDKFLEAIGIVSDDTEASFANGEEAGAGFADAIANLINGLTGFVQFLKDNEGTINGFISTLQTIASLGPKIGEFVKIITGAKLAEALNEFAAGLAENIGPAFDEFKNNVTQGWEDIKTSAEQNWNLIKEGIEQRFDEAKEFVAQKIADLLIGFDNFKAEVNQKWEDIKLAIQQKIEAAKQRVIDVIERVKNQFNTIKQRVVNIFEDIKNTIKNKISEARNTINEKINLIKSKFDEIKTKIQNAFQKPLDTVQEIINTIKNTIAGIPGKISKIQADISGKIGDVLGTIGLAKGGIVPRYAQDGTMVNFRPRGTDTVPAMLTPGEAVMSKKAVEKFLAGDSGNTNINISLGGATIISEGQLIEKITQAVQAATARQNELNIKGLL